jgi:CheY-like chemotaxis protein
LLDRIVRNFATNALRYTEKGGVLIGCRRGSKSARICVVDTGPGIPAQRHEEIFEEFMQLSNPERDRSKGLGLGLAIVRRLAQILEHPVTLKSQPGRGSVFAVEVPLGTTTDMNRNQPTEVTTREDRSAGFIIVIDDETLLLDGFKVLLEGWGHAVLTAKSGAEILDKLVECEQVPDMIICDYRLRDEETGIQVIQQLREEFNQDIPAILVTGDTARERLLEAKAHDFQLVHKPVDTEELRALVNTTLAAER